MTTNVPPSGERRMMNSQASRLVVGTPSARTRAFVRSFAWWQAPTPSPIRRRVFPEPVVPIVVDLSGPGWFLECPAGVSGPRVSSLGVGLHRRFGVLNAPANPSCVLLQLNPLGAYGVFGVPLHQLSNQTFDVADVWGPQLRELRERLLHSVDPQTALGLVDTFIAQRAQHAKEPSPAVAWAWQHLLLSNGNVAIDELAGHIGWSRKHLRQRFLEQVGASPKAAAQLIRFSATTRRLRTMARAVPLASLAAEFGYADQAHMCRAFRYHADCTPREFSRLVDEAGVARPESPPR